MVKTDYFGVHESKYQKLKKEGSSGWNSLVLSQDSFKKVNAVLTERGIESGVLLELGCGVGDLSLMLAQKGYKVYGIDISFTAIAWAKEKSQVERIEANFEIGSVLELPYSDGYFDVVIDALCFHCIIGKDRSIFLKNVFRVLKSQGLFIVMTKCGEPDDPNYPFDPVTRCKIENGIATRYWGLPDSLVKEIQSEGFEALKWKVYEEFSQPLFFAQAIKP
jgi:ubiquinone/menaquinone biosynthesis C-methylase UbiE